MSEPETTKTARGFDLIEFRDRNSHACSLQQSSAVGAYEDSWEKPGSSFLWLGVDDPEPKVMASDARRLGVATTEENGWVPYPIPAEVLLSTRMHLDREAVTELVGQLNHWLETGRLAEGTAPAPVAGAAGLGGDA